MVFAEAKVTETVFLDTFEIEGGYIVEDDIHAHVEQ